MQTSDEIKARLQHGAYELRCVQQLLATASDRIQTAFDEVQVCNGRADLIDPAVDALNHQIHALNEEMDRVYALRSNESDSYLRQENAQLKRDLAALHEALRLEMGQRQAQLVEFVKSNEELNQRILGLERFNTLLKTKLKEIKEQYESAIIDVISQKDTIADQAHTIKTLQSVPAFNADADAAAFSYPIGGTSPGLIPFGKTVVETNRGLTVTIESSRASSPEKASLNHDWIPQLPSDAAFPFPDLAPQSHLTDQTANNGASTEIAIRTPGRPKGRAIIKGTKEANESFERMQRTLISSPLPRLTDTINIDKNVVAPSSSASKPEIAITRRFDVDLVTPDKVRPKLNPAVEAFTPSNSSGKDSAKSPSMQASSPSKNEFKFSATATTSKNEGFILPHLRAPSKISMVKPVTNTEKLSVKDHDTVATSAQNAATKEIEPLQATSLAPRILPHLRRSTNDSEREDIQLRQVQRADKGKAKEETVGEAELLSRESTLTGMKENLKATTTPGTYVRPDPKFQAWLDSQEKSISNNASSHESASLANDTLIEIDFNHSPKAGEKKPVPLPPGFIPISIKDDTAKIETAAPIKTDRAATPTAVHDSITSRNPIAEDEETASGQEVPTKTTSDKERNAAFMAEYNRHLSSVSEKYGRDSRKGSDAIEDEVDPFEDQGAEPKYIRPKPNGTHELGALLDDECSKLVMRPRRGIGAESTGQEWKAVRKHGKVVYVL